MENEGTAVSRSGRLVCRKTSYVTVQNENITEIVVGIGVPAAVCSDIISVGSLGS